MKIEVQLALVPAVELVAAPASASSGFAEARGNKTDAVGVFTVAFVTAIMTIRLVSWWRGWSAGS